MTDKEEIKVIIADDSPQFIEGLNLLLSKNGKFKVIETCKNGLELIQSINLSKANLLLVDIQMPEMSGLVAAKKINCSYPNIPMIALSMHKESIYLEEIISCGFKAFIYKPETAKELINVIQLTLDNKYVFPEGMNMKNGSYHE